MPVCSSTNARLATHGCGQSLATVACFVHTVQFLARQNSRPPKARRSGVSVTHLSTSPMSHGWRIRPSTFQDAARSFLGAVRSLLRFDLPAHETKPAVCPGLV